MQRQREPICHCIEQDDGTSKSLKMSIGKKTLQAKGKDNMTRLMYTNMFINGVSYCRHHLMICCHLCQANNWHLHEETDEEWRQLGLREGGDPRLAERAEHWSDYILSNIAQEHMKIESLIEQYGRDDARTHPQHWNGLMREWTAEECQVNDRFLADNDDVIRN